MKSEEEKKKESSTNQEHHSTGDNVAGDKHEHHYGEKKYPKHLSAQYPTFNPEKFVGRTKALQQLHLSLQSGNKTLLLNGLGGIGKTSVARMYCHLHEADYDHFVWLNQADDFETACTNALGLQKNLGITLTDNPQQTIQNIFHVLNTIEGNNLLVLDNADRSLHTYTDQLPKTWKTLVTSREKMDDRFTEHRLDTLDIKEAKLLFKQYFTKASFSDTELQKLCDEIGYHTLTLELLAKTLQESWKLQTITDLLTYLQNNRLDADALQEEVSTNHSKVEVEIYAHLLQAFDLAELGEEERWLLLQFAVLPPIAHEAKDFLSWIQKEDTTTYSKLLKKLHKKGWLERKKNTFAMHRMIQSLIRHQEKPTYKNCQGLVDTFTDLLYLDQSKDNPIDKFQWIEYGM
ncbi:MAG: NB-ARC domain-containing protein, partial [Saprospiraceae bacterium]